jgi:hypothetical protein
MDGWRRRIVVVPQFHENHVLTGTFAFNLMMGRRWPPQPGDFEELDVVYVGNWAWEIFSLACRQGFCKRWGNRLANLARRAQPPLYRPCAPPERRCRSAG